MSVYKSLWENNLVMAKETWGTSFMQHMKAGDLQSFEYVNFTIQDIKYLQEVTARLKTMSETVMSPEDLRFFFQDQYKNYKQLSESMLKQFHLKEVKIEPIPALEKYLHEYNTIMDKEESIFFAVSLLAHSRLRLWLANQLVLDRSNAYYDWMQKNKGWDPESSYKKLLDQNLKSPGDIELANKIFRQNMQHECNLFAASCE